MNLRHARQLLYFTHCFYCGKQLGIGEEYTIVLQAILPPRFPNRWNAIGKACCDCEDRQTTFEFKEALPLK